MIFGDADVTLVLMIFSTTAFPLMWYCLINTLTAKYMQYKNHFEYSIIYFRLDFKFYFKKLKIMYFCLKEKILSGTIKLLEWKELFCSFFIYFINSTSFGKEGFCSALSVVPDQLSGENIEQLGTQHNHLSFTLMLLLACWSALLPHGLQHPYTDLVHHEAPGSTAKEIAHRAVLCAGAGASAHDCMCKCVHTRVWYKALFFLLLSLLYHHVFYGR